MNLYLNRTSVVSEKTKNSSGNNCSSTSIASVVILYNSGSIITVISFLHSTCRGDPDVGQALLAKTEMIMLDMAVPGAWRTASATRTGTRSLLSWSSHLQFGRRRTYSTYGSVLPKNTWTTWSGRPGSPHRGTLGITYPSATSRCSPINQVFPEPSSGMWSSSSRAMITCRRTRRAQQQSL